jgi:hypothetical protein
MAVTDKLETLVAFNKMLTAAAADVGTQTALLSENKTALEGEQATLDALLAAFAGDVDTACDDVDDATEAAGKELADMEKAAGTLANERLGDVAKSLQDAGAAFVKEAVGMAQRLRDGCASVESDGFDAGVGGLDSAEKTIEAATEASTAAFDQLATKAKEAGRQFTDAVKGAFAAAREAAPDAVGAADEVSRVGEAVETALAQHASAAAERFSQPRQEAAALHEAVMESMASSGEALLTDVGNALADLGSAAIDVGDSTLGAFDSVLEESFPAHAVELGKWGESMFEAKGAAWEFPAAVKELRDAVATAKTVAGILASSLG